jgi:hypothetical protein
VCGLASDDDRTVYRFKRVTEAAYKKAKLDEASGTAVYAFARAAISEGALNAAKYAMVSTRNFTLLQEHGRALTGEQIAAFADALDRGHKGQAKLRAVRVRKREVLLELASKSSVDLELLRVEQKKELFEATFKRRLVVKRV